MNMTVAPQSLTLREVVERYRQLGGGFARPVPLAAFGLSQQQTERVFGIFDEDYNISRFFHFSLQPAADGSAPAFRINGFAQSHVALDAEIESIL